MMISEEVLKIYNYFDGELTLQEIEELVKRGIIKIVSDWVNDDYILEKVSKNSGNIVKRVDEESIIVITSDLNYRKKLEQLQY